MNYLYTLSILLLSTGLSWATVYGDSENGASQWSVYDNNPSGATIETFYDDLKESTVMVFKGEGKRNAYLIGARRGVDKWENKNEKNIKWDMKFDEKYKISIFVHTKKGKRTLLYYSHDEDRGIYKEGYIRFGLGGETKKGQWKTINRDLEADLKKFEPDNTLLEVNGFKVQGSGRIDKLELTGEVTPPKPMVNEKIYENAEDDSSSRWEVIKVSPSGKKRPDGATVTVIEDESKASKVIKFQGQGRKNAYLIGGKTEESANAWREKERDIFSWQMKSSEKYRITLYAKTKNGYRSFYVTQSETSAGFKKGKYIYVGLGKKSMNNQWQTFSIDLDKEIKRYEEENELISINGIKVQGSISVDNILMGGKRDNLPQDDAFLKLALSSECHPEKQVTLYKKNNMALIFTNPQSIYGEEHMGLTKVDISDPDNPKSLGYIRDIFKVHEGYKNNTLMPADAHFCQHNKNSFILKKPNSNLIIFTTVYLDEKSEEDMEVGDVTEAKKVTFYSIYNDLKPLKILNSFVTNEKQLADEDFPSFRISPISEKGIFSITHWWYDEGAMNRTYYISKTGEVTRIKELDIFNDDDGNYLTYSFKEENKIKIVEHFDSSQYNLVGYLTKIYDASNLPTLTLLETIDERRWEDN